MIDPSDEDTLQHIWRCPKCHATGQIEGQVCPECNGNPFGCIAPCSYLDDSKDARRRLVQDKITGMLDPRVPAAQREEAINWTKALDHALVAVDADPDVRAPYKQRK